MTTRQLALDTLLKIEQNDAYSNLSVAGALKNNNLEGADKAFFTSLVYGVVERKLTLDFNLELYLTQPLKKLRPEARNILRLGAYQLLFMDKIPAHAAINESVKLAKKNKAQYAAGLINAVLRKISTNGLRLPKEDADNYLEIKYSCPSELINHFINSYGKEKAIGILEHANGPQKIYGRQKGVGLVVLDPENLSNLPNDIHIQDKASQLCCEALDPKPGETVFDMCAAPGGKSFTIAELMNDEGVVKSFDLYDHRVKLINDGAKRLGLKIIEAKVGDAEKYDESLGLADRVLCDVPCSGLGDISRKPEIRYKKITDIDLLPSLQYNILIKSARYLKENGTLVYSTCALNPSENEQVVKRFLDENEGFKLKEQRTIFPQDEDCDGFFYAVLVKGDNA
ncbi:MAG: 16S rRNA (cytosine(967)-C(5))-methyltransferase RsmB [Clostridia bacterium]|nr:16S rRNA (cytosine(967)-C(5))-methyltransferase RsmB [Clostridia bacterium]